MVEYGNNMRHKFELRKEPIRLRIFNNCSSFEDYENGEPTRFIGGLKCPYSSFKKLHVVEVGHTDEPIETTEMSEWKSIYDKEPICKEKKHGTDSGNDM